MISTLNANEPKLDKITLQLQWKHQFEFAGFYAAKEKGFYADIGLDVEFVEFGTSTNIIDEVLSSRADYGLGYSSIISDYLNGKDIAFLANFFKQSPLVLVTQKDITSLSQLKGAKIEGLSNSIDNLTLFAMLDKFGIKDSDVNKVPSTFKIDNFVNKKVDVLTAFTTNELFLLDEAGVKYNVFDPITYGAKYYDLNLFTSKEEVLNNPNRVQKFKEASIKGWEYALNHQNEIVELILRKYNTQNKSKKALLFEAKQVEQIVLAKVHKIGSIDSHRIKTIADNFLENGFVKSIKKDFLKDFIFKIDENKLTDEELNYLINKKNIKICIDPLWMPVEAIVDSRHVGISADYWKLFESELGIDVEVVKTQSWSASIDKMKNKKCDVLSFSAQTQDRKKYSNFTDSILDLSLVVVTSMDKKSVIDFDLIDGVTLAVVKDYALISIIRNKYPNINILEVKNIDEGLKMLDGGKVYGFADTAVAIDYAYKNASYSDFKVSAHFNEKLQLGLAIQKDEKTLYNIFKKIVRKISPEQKKEIIEKWFYSKYEKQFDYILFYKLIALAVVIIFIFIYRHYYIRKLNKELKIEVQNELKKSEKKDKMIYHQSKLIAMGEMIENIAHQWRQPLSQINSCVLVIDDALEEKDIKNKAIEDKLLEIESLTKHMSNTINDFKNFFDKDKKKTSFRLDDTMKKSIKILEGKISDKNIEVSETFEIQSSFFGYQNELQHVFLAIINNAIDALESKNVDTSSIKIEMKTVDKSHYIYICDNAGGINKESIEKIFEPYYTTKYKTQGTGLGLYISKRIIEESMGGKLSVKNLDGGACFIIELGMENEY
ncbi:ABC transporter substrate-binding protein [Sulfurimonas sp.]